MKRLFFKTFGDSGWRRALHLTLCAAWVSTACGYACLAYQADLSRTAKLPRAGFHVPAHHRFHLSNAHLDGLLNSLGEKYDARILSLESSLQNSAETRLRVDSGAAVLSALGLVAQVATLRRFTRTRRVPNYALPSPARKPGLRAGRLQPATLHEGSFPEGGYAS